MMSDVCHLNRPPSAFVLSQLALISLDKDNISCVYLFESPYIKALFTGVWLPWIQGIKDLEQSLKTAS